MKKIILFLFIFSLLMIYSCGKDESAPVIMLKGDSSINHLLNSEFEEPGFAAFDNEDGDITENVVASSFDIDKAEEQEINYSVSDAEGNKGEITRTIIVYNQANILDGSWTGEYVLPYPNADGITYIDNINSSESINKEFVISDFGGNIGANIIGTLGTTTISFDNQTIDGSDFSVQQSNISDNSTKITIEYTIGTDKGVMVLVKNN